MTSEPEGEGGASDAGAGDQDGTFGHGRARVGYHGGLATQANGALRRRELVRQAVARGHEVSLASLVDSEVLVERSRAHGAPQASHSESCTRSSIVGLGSFSGMSSLVASGPEPAFWSMCMARPRIEMMSSKL